MSEQPDAKKPPETARRFQPIAAAKMLERINPKFIKWHDEQSDPVKAAIAARWRELGADPAINHGWHSANHAKQTALLKWCADNFGYDFS